MGLIGKATVLGLSTGIYCLGYCLLVIFPLVFAEERTSMRTRAGLILEFSFGRLMAYLVFGGVMGYLGQSISNPLFHKLIAGSIVVLSVLLVLYGLLSGFPQLKICLSIKRVFPAKRFPVFLGVFTGFNVCPPFLLAVTYVFNLGEVTKGVVFFFIFFITTSLYLVPFIFIGYFSKFEKLRWIAQMSAVLAGGLFFWIGVNQLLAG